MGKIINETKVDRTYVQKVLLIVCIGFGLFMMCHNLFHSALWGDEWCEYEFSQFPLSGTEQNLYYIITQTYQPPLYNFIMHWWLLISKSITWFRLFNLIPGMISLIALHKTVKEVTRDAIWADFSIIVLSCCYQWIYYVQECAEYCLMLMFLFLSLLFWLRLMRNNQVKDHILFVIFIVCSIYSQYGAIIAGLPLLGIAYLRAFVDRKDKRGFWKIQPVYGVGGVLGLVLYYYFLSFQATRMQEVYSYRPNMLSVDNLGDLLINIGKVLHWMFNLPNKMAVLIICYVIGFIILTLQIWYITKKKEDVCRYLFVGYLLTYLLHFILYETKLYARGIVEGRYSLFFLPMTIITIIVLAKYIIDDFRGRRIIVFGTAILVSVPLIFNAVQIWRNWSKAYDDVIAKIWYEYVSEKGFDERIYFCGYPSYPVRYYTTVYGADCSTITKNLTDASITDDLEMDDEFWLWSTGWSNENYEKIIDHAKQSGYDVRVFCDYQQKGALAYCKLGVIE